MALRTLWIEGKTPVTSPPEVDGEAAAVARAKSDPRAFDSLYRSYVGPIYGYCYQRLGSAQAAEDATQQVFTQALARLHTCRDESFRGWLFTIAHNVTANLVRSWRSHVPLDMVSDVSETGALDDTVVNADLAGQLREMLKRLNDDQRRVIELRFSGVSGAETARILGMSEGAVKQHQRRGLLRLRAMLGLDPEGKAGPDA